MPRITVVRYEAKPDRAAENEALTRAVFNELRARRPEGLAYSVFRDGDEFVHMFVNFRADESGALTDLPSFKAFSAGGSERHLTTPDVIRLDLNLVDTYGTAGEMASA